MDNVINEAYGAAPERLYLIGKDGTVFYHGGAGPHFFDLEELEETIQRIESNSKFNQMQLIIETRSPPIGGLLVSIISCI